MRIDSHGEQLAATARGEILPKICQSESSSPAAVGVCSERLELALAATAAVDWGD